MMVVVMMKKKREMTKMQAEGQASGRGGQARRAG